MSDILDQMVDIAFDKLSEGGVHQSDLEVDMVEEYIEGILANDEVMVELLSRGFGVYLSRRVSRSRREAERTAEEALLAELKARHDGYGLTCQHSRSDIYQKCIHKYEFKNRPSDAEDRRILSEFYSRLETIVEDYAHAKLRQILLADAEGKMRYLFNFRTADIHTWVIKSAANADSWGVRNDFFRLALQYMQENEVSTLSDLPQECLDQLNDQAVKIWS